MYFLEESKGKMRGKVREIGRGTEEKIKRKDFVNSFENREEIAGQQHLNSSRIGTNVKGYNPKGYFKALQSHCTTFFFTNIPESHGISEMWTVFSKWGSVGDVIIPQKRDKRGNRFGFVRFKQTDEDDKLLKSLEQVWIGNYKIKINIPRFKRKEDRKFKGVTSTRSILQPVGFQSKMINREGNHSSWKDILLNCSSFPATTKKQVPKYIVPKSCVEHFNKQWVAEIHRWDDVYNLQEILNRKGIFSVQTTHMGGKLFLLKSVGKEEVDQIFKNEEQWWKSIFKEINKWSPTTRPLERLVWIQCFGVPAQAWSEDFFKLVLEDVGELIRLDEDTKSMARLDLARCLVACPSMHQLNFTQSVSIGEMEWEIRVIEEILVEPCNCCKNGRMEKGEIMSSTSVDSEDGE
ncbi:hypothetical protein Lal_00025580 [Lupinus albus]|nr:hypothetical protein Lal_00025580 [Lupinus albus]